MKKYLYRIFMKGMNYFTLLFATANIRAWEVMKLQVVAIFI